jgi:cytochrome c peroxidase
VLTANHTADSISLVDLKDGKVLAEAACGRKPVAVACTADGKRAAVSNLWSASVTLFDIERAGLARTTDVEVGLLPRSLTFAPDGKTLYVAVAGDDEVIQLDVATRKLVQRWSAPREPRLIALSPDGNYLAAASSRTATVYCWSTETRRLHWQHRIEDAFNLHGLAFAPDGQHVVVAHEVKRAFPISRDNIDKGWAIDSRLTRLALDPKAVPHAWQIALDTRGAAVGDPQALGWAPDGSVLAVAGAGTHEVLLFQSAGIAWSAGDPGDFIDPALELYERFHRVALGGRPTSLVFSRDGKEIIIANQLRDAVQIVDVKARKLVRTIPLGPSTEPSLARRGEALFYDAQRAHHNWFSCHTCHVDGHTNCVTFDTLNDDSYGNPKMTPTLRNVAKTAPYTWHGWQKELGDAVVKSLTETMFGPEPKPDDVKALVAFLGTLEHPPRPAARRGNAEAIRHGKELFAGKAGCARCHQGEQFTSMHNYDVKLEEDGSPFTLWNPPSLRGVWDRGPYLHDGRADTLDEVLDTYHQPERLGGKVLTAEERRHLVAYLKSLD